MALSSLFRIAALLSLLIAPVAGAKEREETVVLFQNRKVSIVVPDGLGFAMSNEDGAVSVRIADQKQRVDVMISFRRGVDDLVASARSRREYVHQTFQDQVEGSVEKAMEFEELEPRVGAGTYCVFTDADIAGKPQIPAGQYLHATNGVKAWPGVVAVFSFLSQDTKSKEYQAVMKMLRESVQETPAAKAAQ